MKCVEVEKHIDSLVDDELSPSLGDKVELHLKECLACVETFQSLQALRAILRKDVSASGELDGRVMEAFTRHYAEENKPKWRTIIFGQTVVPKPALGLALAAFAVFTGLAFLLGKTMATDIRLELPVTETANLPPQISAPNLSSKLDEESESKTSPAQIIKFIEVPVIREKIVTRIIYVAKPLKENDSKDSSAKSKTDSFALNSSVNENRFLTQANLKDFQPVAEMKAKIIKKDENYEK